MRILFNLSRNRKCSSGQITRTLPVCSPCSLLLLSRKPSQVGDYAHLCLDIDNREDLLSTGGGFEVAGQPGKQ